MQINVIVAPRRAKTFKLKELYAFEETLRELFPSNKNIKAKIRQVLQQLRDEGVVEFLGDGQYKKL